MRDQISSALVNRIKTANEDLITGTTIPRLIVTFDEPADVLYVAFDQPRPAIALDVIDGMVLRYDPDSLRIVGLTVESFKRYFLPRHPEFKVFITEQRTSGTSRLRTSTAAWRPAAALVSQSLAACILLALAFLFGTS